MAYRSDVRFKLLKKDYDELVEKYEEKRNSIKVEVNKILKQIEQTTDEEEKERLDRLRWDIDCMSDLFNKDEGYFRDLIQRDIQEPIWDSVEDDETENLDMVYFGWNSLKWYDGYGDVDFIMNFVRSRKYYAYARIGEEVGDIDNEQVGMESIDIYVVFGNDEE